MLAVTLVDFPTLCIYFLSFKEPGLREGWECRVAMLKTMIHRGLFPGQRSEDWKEAWAHSCVFWPAAGREDWEGWGSGSDSQS